MKLTNVLLSLGGAAVVGGASAIGGNYLFKQVIERDDNVGASLDQPIIKNHNNWAEYAPRIRENKRWLKKQDTELITVRTFDGLNLYGLYLPAKEKSNKLVICVHGFRSKGESEHSGTAKEYHSQGFNVMIVDDRAHGMSEGRYVGFGILDSQDCRKWIDLGVKLVGRDAEIYLHGVSMGGATVLYTGTKINNRPLQPQVKGIIADCPFTSPWDVFSHVLNAGYKLPTFPVLNIASEICKRKAGYTFSAKNNLDSINEIEVPVLFIHGDDDNFVPTWMSKEMFAARTKQKKILIVKGAGHGESFYADKELYMNTIYDFIKVCEETNEQSNKVTHLLNA